ncbi:hypothetical protein ACFCYX_19555 [Streptomyces populi]|uniref:hypothetical protein n=1 Tax=Streptomyces populi TaxID=2058924 RepID=UPI0035E1DAF2
MPTVRTTMQPDREIEVDDATYHDLQRWDLLAPEPAPSAPSATAAPATTSKKSAGAAGSKES